ncbi:hypothetical protein ACFQ1I_35150 [Kitasatospora arboriphila]
MKSRFLDPVLHHRLQTNARVFGEVSAGGWSAGMEYPQLADGRRSSSSTGAPCRGTTPPVRSW